MECHPCIKPSISAVAVFQWWSLVKLVLIYSHPHDVIANGMVLISLSECPLLVSKNAMDI
jgi:hypothetical protein